MMALFLQMSSAMDEQLTSKCFTLTGGRNNTRITYTSTVTHTHTQTTNHTHTHTHTHKHTHTLYPHTNTTCAQPVHNKNRARTEPLHQKSIHISTATFSHH